MSATRATPIGTLIRNTHSQPGPSVSTPPTITPIDAAMPPTAPKMPSALFRAGTLGERARDDREGGRRGHRRAESLRGPRPDELGEPVGETGRQGGSGEHRHAGDQHQATAEQVGGPAPEEEEATEHQPVGDGDPLQVRGVEPQIGLDRRDRHIDDGEVEDDHELGARHQRQDDAAVGGAGGRRHQSPLSAGARRRGGSGRPWRWRAPSARPRSA